MKPSPRLVVIGNGMAGIRTVEELLKLAPGQHHITVFGAEPHPNYNRILLSPVLAGEQRFDDIVLNTREWYAEHGIELHTGVEVVDVDRRRRLVKGADGREAPYDRLLIATGSTPIRLPVPGAELPGVLGYRDIADTQAMIDAAAQGGAAVVIGGGLLGLEAAWGLARRGMDVTVVHLADWLMERQLDDTAASMLERSLCERGLHFVTGAQTEALLAGDDGRVAQVRLADGRVLPARLVVMAAGIRPNTSLARHIGLHCGRGIVVTDTLQTQTDARIYAVGECAEHRGTAYGLVAPLFEQAKVCANHLAEFGIGCYTGSQVSTRLKVTGVELFSAGQFGAGEGTEQIVMSDPAGGVYKKLVLKDDRLVGACLVGDTVDANWYFRLLREARPVGELRRQLLVGEANLGDAGHQGQSKAAAMADDDEVCGCNGVTKGAICKAIKDKGLFTLEDVRKHTKASASCGSCTGLVEQLLVATVGGDYSATPAKKPICGCTDLTHQDVRDAIREQQLTRIADVFAALDWRSSQGCASCRPALNYYLISTWPRQAVDDPNSRFVNERNHGNIQKDGSYSVVPRMWGGETSAAELRRIADVVDKYAIPTVKVTGGQRIDLLGVKKQDLPAVWSDLGMPSGHAYAKGLRTVKTCVGSQWCRFGTQDSTALGKRLERALWRMSAPHKVKLAVSGCPRNCAESGIKDIGIIGVDSGWEVHVGGNGGIKTEVAQFFCKVASADEVLEVSAAFLQLYREEGWYLERTCHFIDRVGLAWCRQRVLDDLDGRRALAARLHDALDGEPDPWHEPERARLDLRRFEPVAHLDADALASLTKELA